MTVCGDGRSPKARRLKKGDGVAQRRLCAVKVCRMAGTAWKQRPTSDKPAMGVGGFVGDAVAVAGVVGTAVRAALAGLAEPSSARLV